MPTISITPINAAVASSQTPAPLGLNVAWSAAESKRVKRILAKYPANQTRSATIPLLKLAQDKMGGWLPVDAMNLVAQTLNLPYIRVYEVASFYTMFNLKPVGKFHVQVCTNCSCLIRGSDAVLKAAKDFCGVKKDGATSSDGQFTVTEVECLGACVAAPMMQIGTHYFTNLTGDKTRDILEHLKNGGALATYADTPPASPDPVDFGSYKERV